MWIHVDGKEVVEIKLYALSTCGWCNKAKKLLNETGVAYDYVFVDTLNSEDKDKAIAEMETFVEEQAFPLLIVDGKDSILGFKADMIKKAIRGK